jgi:hypothetical protein
MANILNDAKKQQVLIWGRRGWSQRQIPARCRMPDQMKYPADGVAAKGHSVILPSHPSSSSINRVPPAEFRNNLFSKR